MAGSDVIDTVNSAAAHAIVAAIGKWPADGGKASVIVDTLGGAVGDVDPAGSAFPWRKQSAVAQWYVETAGKPCDRHGVGELRTSSGATVFGRRLRQLPGGQTPAARYFGSNLPQLTCVRQKYDPNRVMFSGLEF